MNVRPLLMAALALAASAATASPADTPPTTRHDAAATWSAEGLARVDIKGLQLAYARPGAALGRYRAIAIAPIRVSLARDSDRSLRDPLHVSAQDEARIESDIAGLVREELAKAFASGGYAVVDRGAPGALELEAAVTDVRLTAPDVRIPGRVDVYARSAGEMTLVATLRDAEDGRPLLRVFDRAETVETPFPHHVTRIESDQQLRAAAREWARALRQELEHPRGTSR